MISTDWINICLSVAMLILTIINVRLTCAMFCLNKTMTKIAKNDKQEKTGHDLSIILPTLSPNKNSKPTLTNILILNNKNRIEVICRIFIKKGDEEKPFWLAVNAPVIIQPYNYVSVPCNLVENENDVVDLINSKIYAVTNDFTVELDKSSINCYNKPMETKGA